MSDRELDERQATVYEIEGRQHVRASPGFTEAITRAHAAQQRPRCVCVPGGLETYIAKLADYYVIKRMPGTGHLHAASCPHFEPTANESGLRPLLGTAIREDPSTGLIALRLDFALSKSAVREPRRHPNVTEAGAARSRLPRLSLRGLLHHLWDQADLTRWHPGFEGKRSWATVWRHLQQAAQQNIVGGVSLSSRLYVPEPFTPGDQDAIRLRRSACWARTAMVLGGHQALNLVIAEVKAIEPARYAFHALVKQVPDIGFALDGNLYKSLARHFSEELGIWGASESVRMIMIASFGISSAGVPTISKLSLMPVTQQWLPVENMDEQQLVERLIHEGRAFKKILRYDLSRNSKAPCIILTDRGEAAMPIYS
ncbi:DUF1173 family protein [Pelomonas aquatica]|uniref:DUF1173 family protein n=1 Tax=Pelomonas aquatica TaxID=431058 RepID=UPI00227A7CB7|nr:DUF1173 family protein [Pelomonas aquatica]MCY4754459.1 DUF1173 family protein [Pelomonas aquatica]